MLAKPPWEDQERRIEIKDAAFFAAKNLDCRSLSQPNANRFERTWQEKRMRKKLQEKTSWGPNEKAKTIKPHNIILAEQLSSSFRPQTRQTPPKSHMNRYMENQNRRGKNKAVAMILKRFQEDADKISAREKWLDKSRDRTRTRLRSLRTRNEILEQQSGVYKNKSPINIRSVSVKSPGLMRHSGTSAMNRPSQNIMNSKEFDGLVPYQRTKTGQSGLNSSKTSQFKNQAVSFQNDEGEFEVQDSEFNIQDSDVQIQINEFNHRPITTKAGQRPLARRRLENSVDRSRSNNGSVLEQFADERFSKINDQDEKYSRIHKAPKLLIHEKVNVYKQF